MASKRRRPQYEDSYFSESDDSFLKDSSSESDWIPNMMSSKKIKNKPPQQKAAVKILATVSNSHSDESSPVSGSSAILDRINKCIARGEHQNTPEEEAKTSLRMAARLMAQHNIRQTEIYAEDGNLGMSQNRGGRSIVEIKATTGGKKVVGQGFVPNLARAMRKFFDCMSYSSTSHLSIEWTFYGISENTVSAAIAFEMTHNLILEWARTKKGVSATHSYCMGVAEGLLEMAHHEKEQEEKEAGFTPEDSEAMDDIQEFDSDSSSLDVNLDVALWPSQKQLTLFRNTAKQTAEDFLKEQNIKISKRVKRSMVRDMEAWKSGKKDSRTIDVRRRRLE